jgi:lipopolysaccharide transport system ATP-binding protein
MSKSVLTVEGLGKRYSLASSGSRATYRTLRESVASVVRWKPSAKSHRTEEQFWALRDVSFTVGIGDVVGVIGRNGAGKSTLLKILSRITEPTEGRATVSGRVGSLLEVGTGFHPELTGRENIYLNGAILGMRRAEIARKFDEIVAFAETASFLDTPVKHYSSGMYMRLAFAVAAHLEPDILIVDEVLAVGDAAFQRKCLGKMSEVAKQGRTVLFVSHNMGAVRTLCTRAIVLGGGTVQLDTEPEKAISHYLASTSTGMESESGRIDFGPQGLDFESVTLFSVSLMNSDARLQAVYDAAEPINVDVDYRVKAPLRGARMVLRLSTQEGELALATTDHLIREAEQMPGRYRTRCTIPGGLLNRRTYSIGIGFEIPGITILIPRQEQLTVSIGGGGNQGSHFPEAWPGVMCPSIGWTTVSTALVPEG